MAPPRALPDWSAAPDPVLVAQMAAIPPMTAERRAAILESKRKNPDFWRITRAMIVVKSPVEMPLPRRAAPHPQTRRQAHGRPRQTRAGPSDDDPPEGDDHDLAALLADLAEQSIWLERRLKSIEGQQSDQWDMAEAYGERLTALEDRAVADDAWMESAS